MVSILDVKTKVVLHALPEEDDTNHVGEDADVFNSLTVTSMKILFHQIKITGNQMPNPNKMIKRRSTMLGETKDQ
nr:hypothetical protein [Tanacetum cinerariifolium]